MDAARVAMKHTSDAGRAALDAVGVARDALCPRARRLIDASFPPESHDRAELASRLLALAVLQYAQHMASFRAWRSSARAWSCIARGDAKGTFSSIFWAFATFAVVAEPLRLSRRTYRALLRREMATRFGNDAVQKMLSDDALVSDGAVGTRGASTDAAGTAAVGAPAFARAALDAAADGIESCVALLYHSQSLFSSNFWSAPVLIGCAIVGQAMQTARSFDGYEAKKEAHRAETATERLRELLKHARTNGEAIALANGSAVEVEEAMATLEAGQEFVYRREVLNSRTSFPSDVYESAANLLPVLSIIPRLARGMSVDAWDVQVAMTSFNGVRAALAVLVQNMTMLRTAETHATNVSNLYDALDASSTRASMAVDKNGAAIGSSVHAETPEDDMSLVEVEALTVRGYDGLDVIRGLDFVLCRGDSVAVVGPSGCGKTLLVKTLVGLWTQGSGSARVIDRARVCVLSRKPYLPRGTLLDVCLYPTSSAEIGAETVALLREVMIALGLERFMEYLDVIAAWDDNLSQSEQQRFAVCRAVVNRAELCILDDATCSMDPKDRVAAYGVLKKHVGGILSLGDEVSLPKHHSRTLRVHSDGTWSDFVGGVSPVKLHTQNGEDASSAAASTTTSLTKRDATPTNMTFSPLQMDASRKGNQFIRQQTKKVARALGVKPEKLGVVPTPTKDRTGGKSLSFDPLK